MEEPIFQPADADGGSDGCEGEKKSRRGGQYGAAHEKADVDDEQGRDRSTEGGEAQLVDKRVTAQLGVEAEERVDQREDKRNWEESEKVVAGQSGFRRRRNSVRADKNQGQKSCNLYCDEVYESPSKSFEPQVQLDFQFLVLSGAWEFEKFKATVNLDLQKRQARRAGKPLFVLEPRKR
jgi:hypothetical protein